MQSNVALYCHHRKDFHIYRSRSSIILSLCEANILNWEISWKILAKSWNIDTKCKTKHKISIKSQINLLHKYKNFVNSMKQLSPVQIHNFPLRHCIHCLNILSEAGMSKLDSYPGLLNLLNLSFSLKSHQPHPSWSCWRWSSAGSLGRCQPRFWAWRRPTFGDPQPQPGKPGPLLLRRVKHLWKLVILKKNDSYWNFRKIHLHCWGIGCCIGFPSDGP